MSEREGFGRGGRDERGTDADPNGEASGNVRVRRARPEDYEAITAFTRNTWPGRDSDYVHRIYHEWIADDGDDGDDQRTFVAEADGRAVRICQGAVLTDYEAWAQGMRVDPEFRGRGISRTFSDALLDWTSEHGASVCRNMEKVVDHLGITEEPASVASAVDTRS